MMNKTSADLFEELPQEERENGSSSCSKHLWQRILSPSWNRIIQIKLELMIFWYIQILNVLKDIRS